MLVVEHSNHLLLINDQHGGRGNGRRRPDANRLAGEASLAKKIARSQNRHDGLFAGFIDYREPHPAFLNV